MPKVWNVKDKKRPVDAIFIGRDSKWGNPFHVGRDGTRYEVIAKYEKWLWSQPSLLRDVGELKGKDLVCFCAPKACHGDILIRLANSPEEEW